jgi:hypothetical protein
MSCCESCGGITLFKGEDGNTIYNGVGAPTIVANEGDFYIDTNTYEIYGPYTGGSWGSGTSLVGPAGAVGAAGVGITNIAWTSNSGGQPQGTQGTTDTYTITLSDASTYTFVVTNGADGANANSNYNNTVFVDASFGNDLTGTRERFDLPFLTISAAMTAAGIGDTVYIRTGSYTDTIVLRNGINVYADNGAILTGAITDNGLTVSCAVRGHLQIGSSNPNIIDITGTNSNVSIECEEISTIDTSIRVEPTPGNTNQLSIKVRRIVNLDLDYFITVEEEAKVFVEVLEYFETQTNTSATASVAAIEINNNFTGELHFTCPRVILGTSTNAGGGVFLNERSTQTGNGRIYIDVNEIINNYNFASPNELYTISKQGATTAIINVNRLVSITRGGILVNANHPTGYVQFTGKATSKHQPAFRYTSSQKCIIKNSTLKRNELGANADEVVVIGAPTGYPMPTDGINSGYALEIINTEIIKDKGNLAGASTGIIGKDGVAAVNIKDSDIYGFNTFGAGTTITAAVANGDVFFKNTLSNVVIGANGADTSAAGGFSVDPGLDLYDYID